MAWTAPMTYVDGTALTAAQLNAFLRDNLSETMAAKAQTPGAMFVTTDVNQLAECVPATQLVSAPVGTSSTAYGDLASSPGPAVTLTTRESALVLVSGLQWCNATNQGYMSWSASGATTLAASDNWAYIVGGTNPDQPWQGTVGEMVTALTPGLNTFTAKYRVTSGGCTFGNRRITVIPF